MSLQSVHDHMLTVCTCLPVIAVQGAVFCRLMHAHTHRERQRLSGREFDKPTNLQPCSMYQAHVSIEADKDIVLETSSEI